MEHTVSWLAKCRAILVRCEKKEQQLLGSDSLGLRATLVPRALRLSCAAKERRCRFPGTRFWTIFGCLKEEIKLAYERLDVYQRAIEFLSRR
jgi:hypothetical protein